MKSDIMSLDTLYEYVRIEDPVGSSLHGNSPAGRAYAMLVKPLTAPIEDERGFYPWGKYEAKGLWRNLYLGKAGYGKTSHLRARINEELRDERWFLWSSVLTEGQMHILGEKHYPSMWVKYGSGLQRVLKKSGTSHIVWVATPEMDNSNVHNVEADLIETLNPTENISRPTPPKTLQLMTKDVIGHFRQQVHDHRPFRSV